MRNNKEYHMYDTTSPKFQDKEINIPDNKIIDDDILPPPTRKFLFTFKPIDKKLIIIEQSLDNGDMNEILDQVLAVLDDFRTKDEMTYSAYSTLYDEICNGMQQAYNCGLRERTLE